MKAENTRQRIIDVTTALIESADDINEITVRKIAAKAQVGIGLINHHFHSKDELIELCVQNIIQQVVYQSRPLTKPSSTDKNAYMKNVVKYIMSFLMSHPQVSKISILGDFNKPHTKDNSQGTVYGLANCMSGGKIEKEHLHKAFLLVNAMQSTFLKKEIVKEMLGIDLDDQMQRDFYMDRIVDDILGGKTTNEVFSN